MMNTTRRSCRPRLIAATAVLALLGIAAVPRPLAATPPRPAPQAQQPSEIELVINGDPGTPPRYAVPDFVASTPDAAEAAKVIAQVLWDDLNFEREFYMIQRDTSANVPAASSPEQIPFAAWRELGADAVVFGTVRRSGAMVTVQVRLFNVRSRQSVFSKEYTGSANNPRLYAHTIADEIHQQQRALRGVARTKLAFTSDRNRERMVGPVGNRDVKEIYVSDYDGFNTRRITTTRHLNINPSWSPDGRALAYTSYRRITPDIFVSLIYQGILENPSKGLGNNYLPVFSPDGGRIAFMSTRDGNPEIYVMDRNGGNVRRLTNHPAADGTPTWSPSGAQLAFTSDRTGQPQIYLMSADGSNVQRISTSESYADRATWSSNPSYNEIAFTAQTGTGAYDIKIYDVATRATRQIAFGGGTNESPAFSPNGRHIAYTSTRARGVQVFIIDRDGRNSRQITKDGNNQTPAWSQ